MASPLPGPVAPRARRHFARKVDAERWLAVMEVSISRGEWLDPADGKVRVGDWAAEWLAGQVQLKPSTFARYELILRKQVLPTWPRVPLSKVTFAGSECGFRNCQPATCPPPR